MLERKFLVAMLVDTYFILSLFFINSKRVRKCEELIKVHLTFNSLTAVKQSINLY